MGGEKKKKFSGMLVCKFFRSLAPFIILVIYTVLCAGIFYAIELNCDPNASSKLTFSSSYKVSTFWEAIHFVATLITTIGYGDVSPCSGWGQLVAIVFSIIGIPLCLVCLTQLGKWFQTALNKLYIRLKRCCSKKGTKNSKVDPLIDTEYVPLSVGVAVTFLWIILCSIYFYFTLKSHYEKGFSFFTAVYFTSITFLTIGLGDISPSDYELVIITFIFIMVGLALVTMCIDIVQTKLEMIFDNVVVLIEKEYKTKLNEDDEEMTDDPDDVRQSVKALFKEDPNAKWYANFMSEKNKNQLLAAYQRKANMKNKKIQTDPKETSEACTEMENNNKQQRKLEFIRQNPAQFTVPEPFVFNTRPDKSNKQNEPQTKAPQFQNEPIPNVPDDSKSETVSIEMPSDKKEPSPDKSRRRNLDMPIASKATRNGRGRNLV